MTPDSIKELLLDLASEDWYGLYELIWRLSALYPSEDESQKFDMAVHALSELVRNGSVVIAKLAEPVIVLSPAESMSVIQQPDNWLPLSSTGIVYGFGKA